MDEREIKRRISQNVVSSSGTDRSNSKGRGLKDDESQSVSNSSNEDKQATTLGVPFKKAKSGRSKKIDREISFVEVKK